MRDFISQRVKDLQPSATVRLMSLAKQMKEEGVVGIFANTTSHLMMHLQTTKICGMYLPYLHSPARTWVMQLVDYFNTHENWDRNGNGKVDYILLQGIQTFSDTINRSSYSLATIEGARI